MKELLLIAALIAVFLAVGIFAKQAAKAKSGKGERPKRKRLMTDREQAMYNRLTQALPELIVLGQVSHGALLTAKTYATRNRFDRKIADFVVCDKALQVLAVIELDDSSHKDKEEKDRARDAMLAGAGYRVLRYPNIPDAEQIRKDFSSK